MKKRHIVGIVTAGVIVLGFLGGAGNQSPSSTPGASDTIKANSVNTAPAETVQPLCDGTTVTQNCAIDDISYATYIYHPAEAEKSHTETTTTYKQEVASYCTQCNDGSYSPSCATGRGACSHHGGVAQWNAPRYRNVPVNTTKKVVDAPAKEAFYEKVTR